MRLKMWETEFEIENEEREQENRKSAGSVP
jgi:hypothetical protein